MKKIITLIAAVVLTASVFAQAPEKMSYQLVVRDNNKLLISTSVGMQISILQGSSKGTAVYVETQTPSTNANGLVSIKIGNGTVVSGDFTTIDWTNGPYYIQTETDPTGGTSYSITSTSRLISVPYAINTKSKVSKTFQNYNWKVVTARRAASTKIKKADTSGTFLEISKNVIGATDSSDHYVGKLYGGGIVFWVTLDKQQGLIASLDDLDRGSGVQWGLFDVDVPNCESMTDGASNTAAIIAEGGSASDAAGLCNSYSEGGFTDWYLPSSRELYLLAVQSILIDSILDNDEDPNTNGLNQNNVAPTFGRYWSSTEPNNYSAWPYYFASGYSTYFNKFNTYRVRAVRAF